MVILKNKKSWFTLIELVVWMAISSIVILAFGNFLLNYYKWIEELQRVQKEFSDVTLWLKSLQKIVFENWKYFTFNNEVFGWKCEWNKTNWINLWNLCNTKFWFIVENSWWQEEEYKVELVDCNIGIYQWKQLVYKNSISTIPLFWTCIISKNWYKIEHKIQIINSEIKEKIFRYYIYTENGIYKQTFFIH
jgi:type II secretory pathway pseudopilin PulG